MLAVVTGAVLAAEEESSNFLVAPNLGVMIWTVIAFLLALYVLRKKAFPQITEALDKRQRAIEESIDSASRTKAEADDLLAEYRERLKEARAQAEEIVTRARAAGQTAERESAEAAKVKREELMAQAKKDIEAETRRAIGEIRNEVADLTVAATEKVTRKTLTRGGPGAPRRGGPGRARLHRPERGAPLGMEEIARVYARSLFEVAQDGGKIDVVKEQLGQFAEALEGDRELAVFFFSPYFSTQEKKDGLSSMLEGPDPVVQNFLELLVEKHRMPAVFRLRREYDRLWEEENKLLPVQVTSAIELDPATIERIGREIGEQTGRKVNLESSVDPDVLGGIVLRVGNSILDASIRTRLENLRKQVSKA